jgi:hypothetical protein
MTLEVVKVCNHTVQEEKEAINMAEFYGTVIYYECLECGEIVSAYNNGRDVSYYFQNMIKPRKKP